MRKTEEVELELRRVLPVRREAVYEAWTRPEVMSEWLAPGPMTARAEVDLREGGTYRIDMHAPDGARHVASGRYLEIVPNERLVFTWGCGQCDDQAAPRYETLVTVELHARGEQTELVLRHARFASSDDRDRHVHGWTGCLEKLEALLGRAGHARIACDTDVSAHPA